MSPSRACVFTQLFHVSLYPGSAVNLGSRNIVTQTILIHGHEEIKKRKKKTCICDVCTTDEIKMEISLVSSLCTCRETHACTVSMLAMYLSRRVPLKEITQVQIASRLAHGHSTALRAHEAWKCFLVLSSINVHHKLERLDRLIYTTCVGDVWFSTRTAS